MVGVDHQQQRRIAALASNAGFLGAAVHEHAQAATMAVLPLLNGHLAAVGGQPGHVLDADILVVVTHQEPSAPQDRVGQAQLDQALDELE
ncbi:hypothetical protein D3C84_881660 [compost metagenome]